MKFIKAVFSSIAEWLIIAMIAIIAVTAWNNFTQPEIKNPFDPYKRDNTVQRT